MNDNKLTIKNNWESLSYWVDGKEIKDLNKVSINGEVVKVTPVFTSVPYYDHGHTYTGNSIHYFFNTKVLGKKVRHDLYDFRDQDIRVI